MNVIETFNLSKYFKDKRAVDDLNLEIPEGVIFGYLGPNGAGKTTTIKLLLNLIKPTKGYAIILGENITKNKNYLKKVGFLPDVPSFYNFFTAHEYLDTIADILGVNKVRIDEVLEIVELKNEKKRIGTFSRGMKQRLGIAQALLSDPEILILDEPTSALDPQGRREILDLVSSLKGEKTIFFSTHILSDVERVCDRVGIIKEGKLVLNDDMENLKKTFSKRVILVGVNEKYKLMERLKKEDWVEEISLSTDGLKIKVKDIEKAGKLIPQIISEENISLYRFELLEPTLEEIFLEVVL
ncbi:MAG TPA: ABC transporter ATP-binding protein [Dictyoglomaceae bacterium]|nr:ABC transporter ATP-binding protein [Dictyoglomaceae bacterium]HOL40091.1 ABC transporter ATP-binding protein [Dictyoglomaceae bacterium]HPP16740.1 ABC transporter ATP-binding protein [Dictyoglomaceae bacterium]